VFGFLLGILARPVGKMLLGAVVVLQGYLLFRPQDPLGFAGHSVVTQTAAAVAADLPDRKGLTTLAVLPFVNDFNAVVAGQVKDAILERGRYEVLDESFFRRLLNEARGGAAPIADLKEAVAAARRIGVDAVVFGEVSRLTREPGQADLALNLRMAERESGQAVFARQYEDRAGGNSTSVAYWRARLADSSTPQRILAWTCIVLLAPLVGAGLIRRVTAEESNLRNGVLLVAMTGIDVLLAWGLTGFWIASWGTAAAIALAAAASLAYNYKVASIIDDLAQ